MSVNKFTLAEYDRYEYDLFYKSGLRYYFRTPKYI